MTPANPPPSMNALITPAPEPLTLDEFDQIDTLLDELRSRFDETPQWEFCEGFMAALICCRRPITASEYLPLLLGIGTEEEPDEGSFADELQAQRFMTLWTRRWNQVADALTADIKSLDDEAAYHPQVMDVRGAMAALPEAERAALGDAPLPSFAQVWALGFMFAVETWPEEWQAPRDKEAVKWLDEALDAIVALTEDDDFEPEISPFDDDAPPSLSLARLEAFGAAVWAVYDLRELWCNFGPRVATVHKVATPSRNDPCSCGSGKKYKKCCGA